MPSIDWSRRKGLAAAQACGEQATGYLTGVAGVRRVKPQNNSGSRKYSMCMAASKSPVVICSSDST
jgi:hypothetical protein